MITLTREEAQQVLDALDSCDHAHEQDGGAQWYDQKLVDLAYELLRARLAEPVVCARCGEVNPAEIHTCTPKEQEPVAWMRSADSIKHGWDEFGITRAYNDDTPLYTAPPQREWQGLTDDEYELMAEKRVTNYFFNTLDYAYDIEAKLKEKNT